MRVNQYVALATGLSRRKADKLIVGGSVTINCRLADMGAQVTNKDIVKLNNKVIIPVAKITILLNKPIGYVCSREGQGSNTIYQLLPKEFYNLKPVGRLDKNSSGLLLMTNDGQLANKLTHPSFNKQKVYQIGLDKLLTVQDQQQIEKGVQLEDGLSQLQLEGKGINWTVVMSEGRNRQIRRTFATLGYGVSKLHRIKFGDYELKGVDQGQFLQIS